jgi:hypothetical protein
MSAPLPSILLVLRIYSTYKVLALVKVFLAPTSTYY